MRQEVLVEPYHSVDRVLDLLVLDQGTGDQVQETHPAGQTADRALSQEVLSHREGLFGIRDELHHPIELDQVDHVRFLGSLLFEVEHRFPVFQLEPP